jgi:hypothetical protein
MAQAYRVCAPYVTVRVNQPGGGETVLGFYEGGTLPESAHKESVEALLAKGMIEETDGPTPEEQAAEDAKVEKAAREKADKAAEQVAAEEQKKADERAAKMAAAKSEDAKQAKGTGELPYDEEPVPPPVSASKGDWVSYAVSQREDGVSEGDARLEAEGKSKNDLINEYGG